MESIVQVSGIRMVGFTVGKEPIQDENGDAIKPVVVNTYEDGKIKWLKTIAPSEE